MVHCDFEGGSQNQHFESILSVGKEGSHKKEYSVYALDDINNSGRPLTCQPHCSIFTLPHRHSTEMYKTAISVLLVTLNSFE